MEKIQLMLKTGVLNNLHKSNLFERQWQQKQSAEGTAYARPGVLQKPTRFYFSFKPSTSTKHEVNMRSAINSEERLCSSGVNIPPVL